jgi:hypothetical protein
MKRTCAVLLVLAALAPSLGIAQRTGSIDVLRGATVFIRVATDNGETTGSGVVLTGNGVIATAAHVLEGARRATVKFPTGEEYDVVGVLDSDERLDITLIQIAGFGLPTALLGNSDSVHVGDRLIAVGAPLGLQGTISDGLLSAIRFKEGTRQFQISIPVSPGSSGGPVATTDGRVIGLVVSGIRGGGAENLNFVIPVNYVRGRLGMIGGRSPTALSGFRSSPGLLSDANRSVPRRVNDSLKANWASLDGVQFLAEAEGEHDVRYVVSTRYSVTPNADGGLTVERVDATRLKHKESTFRTIDVADDLRRTLYNVGRENDFVTTLERRPLVNAVVASASKLTVRGSDFTVVEAGKPDLRGIAAPGVLPADFLGASIGAYPGELPDKLYFWLLDTSSDRPVLGKFEAIRRETRRVRVATEVAGCTGSPKTRDQDMPVVVAAITVGVNRTESAYLSRSPHLLVSDEVKCVRIP